MKKILIYGISIILSFCFLTLSSIIIYNILIYFNPPITPDGLHKIMPIKQAIISLFISFLLSIILFFIIKNKIKRKTYFK